MANFKDIIGQESIKKHLQTAIKTGNLSHAYIINGEYGSGRQTIASALAKTIQCQSKQTILMPAECAHHANRLNRTITLILNISLMIRPA